MPFESLLTPNFEQKGHFCLTLCFDSTFTNLVLTFFPYLEPNLPADFIFFNFDAIFYVFDIVMISRTSSRPTLKSADLVNVFEHSRYSQIHGTARI